MGKSTTAAKPGPVYLVLPDGSDQVTIKNAGEQLAFYWAHVVKSRGRWRYDEKARKALVEDARARLNTHGLDDAALIRIAKARRVEISIPADKSEWASRILPWEFLLRELTKPFRDGGLTIIRHLRAPASNKRGNSSPSRALFVENNPAPFSDYYSYDGERRLVVDGLRVPGGRSAAHVAHRPGPARGGPTPLRRSAEVRRRGSPARGPNAGG